MAEAAVVNHLYSEQSFNGRKNILSSHLFLRTELPLNTYVHPYLQLGSEAQSFAPTPINFEPGSFVYLSPGIRLSLTRAISIHLQPRIRHFFQSSDLPTLDARALLILNYFSKSPISSKEIATFLELYSETVFTSADSNNLIQASFLRYGLRLPASKSLWFDLFVEPFATIDRLGHYYNNRADLKLSLRTQVTPGSLTIGLTTSILYNTYFATDSLETNPFRYKDFGGQALLTIGGTL